MKSIQSYAPLNDFATESIGEQAGEAFRALRRGISRGRGFSLHVAVCNSPVIRDELIANLGASMPGISIHRVDLSAEDEDILDAVEQATQGVAAGAIMVVGIEKRLDDDLRAKHLLASLNLRRSEWPARIHSAVVFWLPRRFMGRLLRGAPDFFDWRSDTLDFPELTNDQLRPLAGREWEYGADPRFTADERKERIAELRTRIAAITPASQDLEVARNILAWWDELADHHRLIGDLDEALRIRQEEQLPVYERLGDVRSRAVTLGKIADVYQARGQWDEALRIRQEEELPVYERLESTRDLLVCRANIGITYLRRNLAGDRQKALELLNSALQDARRLNLPEAGQIAEIIRQA